MTEYEQQPFRIEDRGDVTDPRTRSLAEWAHGVATEQLLDYHADHEPLPEDEEWQYAARVRTIVYLDSEGNPTGEEVPMVSGLGRRTTTPPE